MDRRKALKNMGMSLGYIVATPTLLSIVQSCKTEKVLEWTPDFFTKEQGTILTSLVDIILPKTDTPSASEVQVHLFIDRFSKEVMTKEQQDFTNSTFKTFISKTLKDSGKQNSEDLNTADLEATLAKSLNINKEQQKANEKVIEEYMTTIKENGSGILREDVASYALANNLRGMTIWGYKTSEYIGEEVLAYLPVPGEYIGCGDANELTQGKAWSL